jgi:hypothetical protein
MADGYLAYYHTVLNGNTVNRTRPKVEKLEEEGFFRMTP